MVDGARLMQPPPGPIRKVVPNPVPVRDFSTGGTAVIVLTRLNGAAFALNPDLIERAESTPDTVVTLVDGKKYIVAESLRELAQLVRDFRSGVIAQAQTMESQPPAPVTAPEPHPSRTPVEGGARIVPLPIREA
jgi:flagellar protein FlbD